MKLSEFWNYYVYVRPGRIEYFEDLGEAQKYARYYGVEVKVV